MPQSYELSESEHSKELFTIIANSGLSPDQQIMAKNLLNESYQEILTMPYKEAELKGTGGESFVVTYLIAGALARALDNIRSVTNDPPYVYNGSRSDGWVPYRTIEPDHRIQHEMVMQLGRPGVLFLISELKKRIETMPDLSLEEPLRTYFMKTNPGSFFLIYYPYIAHPQLKVQMILLLNAYFEEIQALDFTTLHDFPARIVPNIR